MVAAWIRALTGVGPSMASGSQTCSGNWALLPTAPTNSSRPIQVTRPELHERHLAKTLGELQRAEGGEDQEQAEREAPVAHAVDEERLLAGLRGALLVEPERDQQVRAQAHALPAQEHQQVVVGQDEDEHGEHEEVQVGEEAVVAAVAAHVADRVVVHEHADRADDDQHDGRRASRPGSPTATWKLPADTQVNRLKSMALVWAPTTCDDDDHAEDPRRRHRASETTSGRGLEDVLAEQEREGKTGQGQQRDEGRSMACTRRP